MARLDETNDKGQQRTAMMSRILTACEKMRTWASSLAQMDSSFRSTFSLPHTSGSPMAVGSFFRARCIQDSSPLKAAAQSRSFCTPPVNTKQRKAEQQEQQEKRGVSEEWNSTGLRLSVEQIPKHSPTFHHAHASPTASTSHLEDGDVVVAGSRHQQRGVVGHASQHAHNRQHKVAPGHAAPCAW